MGNNNKIFLQELGVDVMAKIMPNSVLLNTTEISDTCHKLDEPVFITRDGRGDMVVMSIETYERLIEVYRKMALSENIAPHTASGTVFDTEIAFGYLREKYKK
jgi:PHD/YefM family antitoxin component YafN of YafNO toxin-antitoxin module